MTDYRKFLGLDKPFELANFDIPDLEAGSASFIIDINTRLKDAQERNDILLPNFSKFESIAIFSDYGGEDKTSGFITYSYFITSYEFAHILSLEYEKIRQRNNVKKEFAYKNLADGPVSRSIPFLLESLKRCPGFIFTHAIDKRIHTLAHDLDRQSLRQQHNILRDNGIDCWEPKVLEKVVRILNHITYLFAIFGRNSSKTFWMTDNDSICANDNQTDQLGTSYQKLLSHYSRNKQFKRIGFAKPFVTKKDSQGLNELLSIPDLLAGCISNIVTQHHSGESLTLKESKLSALNILKMMAIENTNLAQFCVIHKIENDEFRCASFKLNPGPDFNNNP